MILWTFERHGMASLPVFAAEYRQHRRAFPRDGVRILLRVTREEERRAWADIEFLGRDGALVASIEQYECIMDPSLNRAFRLNQIIG